VAVNPRETLATEIGGLVMQLHELQASLADLREQLKAKDDELTALKKNG
jgi:hypothetical protein